MDPYSENEAWSEEHAAAQERRAAEQEKPDRYTAWLKAGDTPKKGPALLVEVLKIGDDGALVLLEKVDTTPSAGSN